MREEREKPAEPGTAVAPGLFGSLRRLGQHGLELLQVRAELLAVELEAEKLRLFAAAAQALMALLLGIAALGLFTVSLLLLSPEAWRWLTALGLGLLHAGLAWWCWGRARRGLSQPGGAFAGTLAELARDRASLED